MPSRVPLPTSPRGPDQAHQPDHDHRHNRRSHEGHAHAQRSGRLSKSHGRTSPRQPNSHSAHHTLDHRSFEHGHPPQSSSHPLQPHEDHQHRQNQGHSTHKSHAHPRVQIVHPTHPTVISPEAPRHIHTHPDPNPPHPSIPLPSQNHHLHPGQPTSATMPTSPLPENSMPQPGKLSHKLILALRNKPTLSRTWEKKAFSDELRSAPLQPLNNAERSLNAG